MPTVRIDGCSRELPTMEAKREYLARYHRQNVFNDGSDGDRHERALRRLTRTATWRAAVQAVADRAEYRRARSLERMGY